ncbi:MAG: Re/Si-specific NAD(P)(+) transhydrogenase subunit alpha [Alphaproteobacteria bacterium]|nr:Re/Si-specific NAD(P)(+) transhydrogenase subunit alpha [Alphaproteobacteria bacterium]
MKIAVPKESAAGEFRVAASQDIVKKLTDLGISVVIQKEAGITSEISDQMYQEAGAVSAPDFNATVDQADIILKIQPPSAEEVKALPKGSCLVCLMNVRSDLTAAKAVAKAGVTCFAMELLPRISRAQNMDVLSSQSNLAGYKAVIDAIAAYKKAVPMMMTAAGMISPAQVLVLGAGVAGLQAIATAKRLGAAVTAFDVRPSVKEQVESLGAKFLETAKIEQAETTGGYAKELDEQSKKNQEEALLAIMPKTDIIITTALIPGKKAPLLITEEMLKRMKSGSIVFDLAAEQGGNCYGTLYGKTVTHYGTTIFGQSNAASQLSASASPLFAKNLYNFILPMIDREKISLNINFEDEIYQAACIAKNGQLLIEESTHV